MILDEVDLAIRANLESRGWLSLLKINHPPLTALIRELFSNLACSLPSAGDRSNIILGIPRSNHKERGKFKDNVIKKNNLGEEEKYFFLVIVNKNNNKNLFKSIM